MNYVPEGNMPDGWLEQTLFLKGNWRVKPRFLIVVALLGICMAADCQALTVSCVQASKAQDSCFEAYDIYWFGGNCF